VGNRAQGIAVLCKEQEIEACLAEKAKFWNELMANVETNFNGAELVIHQIYWRIYEKQKKLIYY